MNTQIFVHNMAGQISAEHVEKNKAAFDAMMSPLRFSRYSGKYNTDYSRGDGCIYRMTWIWKSMVKDYETGHYLGKNDQDDLDFRAFIDDIKRISKKIRPRWKTTFRLITPDYSDLGFDDRKVVIEVVHFLVTE